MGYIHTQKCLYFDKNYPKLAKKSINNQKLPKKYRFLQDFTIFKCLISRYLVYLLHRVDTTMFSDSFCSSYIVNSYTIYVLGALCDDSRN
jgi:hypothetical protein